MTSQQDKVTVYSKPACVQCDATYRALDKKGIEYTVVDISADVDARSEPCRHLEGTVSLCRGLDEAGPKEHSS